MMDDDESNGNDLNDLFVDFDDKDVRCRCVYDSKLFFFVGQ